jgi:putative ABC transport system substrate-binding protein
MKRREFLRIIGGAAVWPLTAQGQQRQSIARVGVLTQALQPQALAAFQEGLRDFGYVEGRNLVLETRGGAGGAGGLPGLAAELIALPVDVIFAPGSETTRAVLEKTKTVPVVTVSTNPLGLGFVASLAKPGGNVTGLSVLGPEVAGKRLELLKEAIPGISKIAVLWNPNDPGAASSLKETQAAAETITLQLQIMEARDPDSCDRGLLAANRDGAEAVVLLPAPLFGSYAGRIAELAIQKGLPTLFVSADSVRAGGLISYGPDIFALDRRAAYFVDRILKGARPPDLPVEQPTKFDLALNLKTAKALGLSISPTLLARADEVIE